MRAGRVILDGTPDEVFAADAWDALRSTYLEPPLAAVIGDRLGVGSTPTDASLIDRLQAGWKPGEASARPQMATTAATATTRTPSAARPITPSPRC